MKFPVPNRVVLSKLYVLFTLSFCLSCVRLPPQILQTAPGPAKFSTVTLGLCEDYPEESRSLGAARRDFRVLATNNIHVLRIAFGWDAMEPEPGKYDWSFWDDFVRIATDEYGIQLIPYVCYTPRWASSSSSEDFWQQPPKDNAAFAEFVKLIVTRYKNRIHSWEIWNEPDNPAYWRGTVEQFADLLAAGSHAVREADPKANVVMGGLAWNLNFLEDVITNPAAITNVNVVNLHNYYETWSSDPLEHLPDYIGRAWDILHQHGLNQKLWVAEVGYSSFREGANVSGQYEAWYRDEHTPAAQAASIFRMMTLVLASGKISLAAWYRINDLPNAQEVIGDVNNRHLGILDEHGKAKPALRALNYFHTLFANGFRCLDNEVTITKQIGAPVETHAFQTTTGAIVVIAWLKTSVPGTRNHPATGNAIDSREANISLSFPFPLATKALCYDELGNRRGTLSAHYDNRGTYLSNINVRGDKVSVLILSKLAQ